MSSLEVKSIPEVRLAGRRVRVDQISPPPGSENSNVWCRDITELVGAISHGVGHILTPDGRYIQTPGISESDALVVVNYLIMQGKTDAVLHEGKLTGWNIHHWGEDINFHFTEHPSKRNATIAS